MMKLIAFMTLPLLLLGCSNCEESLANLENKSIQINQSGSRIHQPLYTTIEYKVAKKQCDDSVFRKFKKSLK